MWDEHRIRQLLADVEHGQCSADDAAVRLRNLPTEDLGFARLDHHRALRQGFTEVIFCAGKTPPQAAVIMARLAEQHPRVLGTRATPEHAHAARALVPDVQYHEQARAIWIDRDPLTRQPGVVIVAAGTADLPVAEEAALTLELMGHHAHRIYDVGVAGLHRLFAELPVIQSANVAVVIAGMEGALPTVIGGLISAPIVAVPTSVGYGTGMGGFAALIGMLNSCAPGLAVVNIDNGFGAGCLAARINGLTFTRGVA
jgi:NCAIR mutase (PurE)-related protein